jgi:hypothetical protein
MGFIREPEGVDFVVISKPLTKKDREEIVAFIEKDKKRKRTAKKRTARKKVKVMA